MTFANVTSVTGTGAITNMGTSFGLAVTTSGTAGTIAYTGFTAADTATVTGAQDFNHGSKTNLGMTFANVTSVTGTGAITNMGTSFELGSATCSTAGKIPYTGLNGAEKAKVAGGQEFHQGSKTDRGKH